MTRHPSWAVRCRVQECLRRARDTQPRIFGKLSDKVLDDICHEANVVSFSRNLAAHRIQRVVLQHLYHPSSPWQLRIAIELHKLFS